MVLHRMHEHQEIALAKHQITIEACEATFSGNWSKAAELFYDLDQ
jgi:hypothetical protein